MQQYLVDNHLTLSDEGHVLLRHLLFLREELLDHFVLIVRLRHVDIMCQINGVAAVANRALTACTRNLVTVLCCGSDSAVRST